MGAIASIALGVMALGGNAGLHVRNGSVVFTSDRRDGRWAVYVTNAAGTTTRWLALVGAPNSTCSSVVDWSRDGEHLAYVSPQFGLRTYDAHSGRAQNLVPMGSVCDAYSLSPDGSKLAYTDDPSLRVVDRTRHRYTIFAGNADYSANLVAWSPDGMHIAYVRTDQSGADVINDLEVATADGTSKNVVAANTAYMAPVWSPDGKRVAFAAQPKVDGPVFIDVIDTDGSNRHRLSAYGYAGGDDVPIDWSPDGKQVVFSEPTGTYVAAADGSGIHRIGVGGLTSISWSPDGRLLAYTTGKPSIAWLMDADGSHAHPLPIDLPLGGDIGSVLWNPAGIAVQAISGTPVHVPQSQLGEHTGSLAAFSATTGARIRSFPTVTGGSVDTIISDGAGGWFLGGAFTHVGAAGCARIAHVLPSFQLDRTFCGKPSGEVQALVVLGRSLYVGGYLDRLAGASRTSFGALDIRSGTVRPWQPPRVLGYEAGQGAIGLAALGNSVYLLGSFAARVGATKLEQLAAVDPVSSVVRPWAPKVPLIAVGAHFEPTMDQIDPSPSAVYVDGPYGDLQALDTYSGARIPWRPVQGHAVVWTLAIGGNRLYLGGRFTRFDSAPRRNLATVDLAARTLLAWAPDETRPVDCLGVSPSGVWAAVGTGGEIRIDGFDTSTGSRLPAHIVVRGGRVNAIAASTSIVLVGGDFDSAQFP
jgi:Tol biopolymer transport system component